MEDQPQAQRVAQMSKLRPADFASPLTGRHYRYCLPSWHRCQYWFAQDPVVTEEALVAEPFSVAAATIRYKSASEKHRRRPICSWQKSLDRRE